MRNPLEKFWKRFWWETKKDTQQLWASITRTCRWLMAPFRFIKAHPVICAVIAAVSWPVIGFFVLLHFLGPTSPFGNGETPAEREWRLADSTRREEIQREHRVSRQRERAEEEAARAQAEPGAAVPGLSSLPQPNQMRGGVAEPPPGTHPSIVEATARVAAGEGAMIDHMRAYRHPGQVQAQPLYGQIQDAGPEEKVAILGTVLLQEMARQQPQQTQRTHQYDGSGSASIDPQWQNTAQEQMQAQHAAQQQAQHAAQQQAQHAAQQQAQHAAQQAQYAAQQAQYAAQQQEARQHRETFDEWSRQNLERERASQDRSSAMAKAYFDSVAPPADGVYSYTNPTTGETRMGYSAPPGFQLDSNPAPPRYFNSQTGEVRTGYSPPVGTNWQRNSDVQGIKTWRNTSTGELRSGFTAPIGGNGSWEPVK